jgi:hypothetical protein
MNDARHTFTAKPLPAWFRHPGESWQDWDRRLCAEKAAEAKRKLAEQPKPLDPLYSGSLHLACGVGTYDGNGNPKGSGWW